ncbi:MAG: type 4b pilus protein PilO2 [Trinickia sp.]|jgi:hypothetical protein
MAIHITEIHRHRFICGLFWQSLSRRRELRKEAIGIGRQTKFDLMALRIDRGGAMVGFANRADGARPGMASLGAMVSKTIAVEGAYFDGRQQRAQNWLGAFKLPDGMWAYFAIRDGLFLPNGDWAGPRERVLDRLQADYLLGGWNVVIGEPELEEQGYHNFYPRRIEDLFPRRNGKPRINRWLGLEPVNRTVPRPVVIGATATALAFAVAGPWAYVMHQRQLRSEQEAALRAAHAAHRIAQNAHQPPPHPWATQPRPDAFARACLDAFTTVSAGGWALEQYACTPNGVTYSWTRNGSTIALLLARQPRARIDAAGNHASFDAPLTVDAGGDDTLGTDAVRTDLLSRFQQIGREAKLAPVPAAPAPSGPISQLGMARPAAPDWRAWTLEVNLGGLSPLRVAALIDRPGVRIERLAYHGGQWSLQGEVYVR